MNHRFRTVDKACEIYLCLYQAVTGTEREQNVYTQFTPDFFDLIVVGECHRGSAADDAAWRKVLDYFNPLKGEDYASPGDWIHCPQIGKPK